MYQQGCVSVESCGRGEGNPRVLKSECPNSLCLIGMVIYGLLLTFSYWRKFFALREGEQEQALGCSVSGRLRCAQGGISSHSDLGFLLTLTCEKNS